jgi:hypothetical protein
VNEADSNFASTSLQIIPVLLLALVIEGRAFRFEYSDAIPAVKEARAELRKSMHPIVYWLWRARVAYRRAGISLVVNIGIAALLVTAELTGLLLFAYDQPLDGRVRAGLIAAIAAGLLLVAIKPLFDQLIRQNVELAKLEDDVRKAIAEKQLAGTDAESKVGKTVSRSPKRKSRSDADSASRSTPKASS